MKKLLANLAAIFVATTAMAQSSDEQLWGYYMGNNVNELYSFGYGSNVSNNAYYSVGYFVPGDGVLSNVSITAFNIPFCCNLSNLSELSITIYAADLTTVLHSQAVETNNFVANSFNKVVLSTPFDIPSEGCYATYQFNILEANSSADQYPILITESSGAEKLLFESNSGWTDYTSYFGYALALQLFYTDSSLGDLNGDGQRNQADLSILVDIILGKTPTNTAADLNGDGVCNVADYTLLVNKIQGVASAPASVLPGKIVEPSSANALKVIKGW